MNRVVKNSNASGLFSCLEREESFLIFHLHFSFLISHFSFGAERL